MFHKIKNISALPDFKLSVQFSEGVTKIYDVKPLFEKIPYPPTSTETEAKTSGCSLSVAKNGIFSNKGLTS